MTCSKATRRTRNGTGKTSNELARLRSADLRRGNWSTEPSRRVHLHADLFQPNGDKATSVTIAIALRRQDDVDDARVTKNETLIRRGKK